MLFQGKMFLELLFSEIVGCHGMIERMEIPKSNP